MDLDFFLPKKMNQDLDDRDDAWHEFIKKYVPEVFWNPEVREKTEKGGRGSGNWGHGGLAGVHGGSSPTKTSTGFVSSPSGSKYFSRSWQTPDEGDQKHIETMKKMSGADKQTGFTVSGVVTFDRPFQRQAEVDFGGNVWDGEERIGEISVTYYPNSNIGEIKEIVMFAGEQGTGFGKRYAEHIEDVLVEMGAREITLTAARSVGGYFWAKVGYDFRSRVGRESIQREIEKKWRSRYPMDRIPMEAMSRKAKAWELAALRGPDGHKVGKEAMLGLGWFGSKVVPGHKSFYDGYEIDDTGYKIGKKYYGHPTVLRLSRDMTTIDI